MNCSFSFTRDKLSEDYHFRRRQLKNFALQITVAIKRDAITPKPFADCTANNAEGVR